MRTPGRLSWLVAPAAALSLLGCGARSHGLPDAELGEDAGADGDTDVDADGDADADGDGDGCRLVPSAGYRSLRAPETACASSGFIVGFVHGIGSHECAEMVETHWENRRERPGNAVFTTRIEAFLLHCPDDCCPDGCGREDVFQTELRVPTASGGGGFGAGAYFVIVGDESATVQVDPSC